MDSSRLAAFPLLADLPAAELDEVAAAVSEVEADAGSTVVTLDDYGAAVYFVEQGEADVLRLLSLSDHDFHQIRPRVPVFEGSLRRLGVERAGR
jgi:CRP-like cAMP-binding protein